MITIIQATNRPDSNTEFISRHIDQWLKTHYKGPVGHISMADMPAEVLSLSAYEEAQMSEKLKAIQDQLMVPAAKFIWLLPEYNGSFPGVVKLFIDAISVRKKETTFRQKKSMLIGIATGRAGNIRGLDHMTSILMHMKSIMFPRLLPISKVNELMDDEGKIIHDPTLKVLDEHLFEFLAF